MSCACLCLVLRPLGPKRVWRMFGEERRGWKHGPLSHSKCMEECWGDGDGDMLAKKGGRKT